MITFREVSKKYKKELSLKSATALNRLSFTVQPGEILGFIGPNGAGKSTSIRLLMDFIRPDSGQIQLFGQAPRSNPLLRRQIGYLPDIAQFPPNITVIDLLRFTAQTCGLSKETLQTRSHELLSMLDLWEVRSRPLRRYSKGMQQRANFALALLNDPQLLILDEPMSGLDPIGRKKISDLIADLKTQGKTILFCSHILDDVDRLVDNILLLHKGNKLFLGTPEALLRQENANNLTDAFVSCIGKAGHA